MSEINRILMLNYKTNLWVRNLKESPPKAPYICDSIQLKLYNQLQTEHNNRKTVYALLLLSLLCLFYYAFEI